MPSQFLHRSASAAIIALGGALHLGCLLPDYVEAEGNCQSGSTWTQMFGGDLIDAAATASSDPCGGVTVGGAFQSSFADFGLPSPLEATKDGFDGYVARMDAAGDVQWVTAFGAEGHQAVSHVKTDIFGNALAAGAFDGNLLPPGGEPTEGEGKAGSGEVSAFLTKLDLFGVHRWTKVYRAATNLISTGPCGVAVDRDGRVTMAGIFLNELDIEGELLKGSLLSASVFLAHYDPDGALLWAKSFSTSLGVECAAVTADQEGNILLTGVYRSKISFGGGDHTAEGDRFYVLKMSRDGALVWSRGTNSGNNQIPAAIATDAAGNVFVGGSFSGLVNLGSGDISTMEGTTDMFLQKLNSAGTPQWGRSYASPDQDSLLAIEVDSAGDLVIAGDTFGPITFEQTHEQPLPTPDLDPMSPGKPARDAVLARLRGADGEPIASRTFKGTGDDSLNALAIDQADFPIVTGTYFKSIDLGLGPGPGALMGDNGLGTIYVVKMAPLAPPP